MSTSPIAVETAGLVKTFGATRALAGVDLTISRGSIYGLLGPNGAGKTTMVRVLATLLTPDAGRAMVLGYDVTRQPQEVRRRISLTGQAASVDEDLTARDNLVLIGRLLGLTRRGARARAGELLAAFDLASAAEKQVKHASGGMRRRLDIAATIVRTPDLLFLDEPTTGLDPRSRSEVWEIIRALSAGGTTVLLTTQYLEEADQLAGRIAVIDHGAVIAEGTPSELKASIGSGALHVRVADPSRRDDALRLLSRRLGEPARAEAEPHSISARLSSSDHAAAAVAALGEAGIAVTDFSLGQPSLDEVFFALTGRAAEDSAGEAADQEQRGAI